MNNYILTFTGEIKVHIRANSEFNAVRGAKQELLVEQNILCTDNCKGRGGIKYVLH